MQGFLEFAQDIFMLALVVWREARGEPRDGKIAVAHSILNRVHRPSWWGRSVMSVVTKKWQYSSMTDPNDRQLARWPQEQDPEWEGCMMIALGVYEGTLRNPAPGADSYYADTISSPKWADAKKFVVQIGHHRFYDLDSDHERQTS